MRGLPQRVEARPRAGGSTRGRAAGQGPLREQRGGLLHALGDRHAEGAAGLARLAGDAVGARGIEGLVVGAHAGGDLVLHRGQVVELVHQGDVDARGTGRAVAAVRALAEVGVLGRAGKLDKLAEVRKVAEMVNIMSVRQKRQLGLGHAVLCARELVRDDPFAIMVGDDLMFGGAPGIGQLIEVAMAEKMPVIGVMEVPWEKVSRYGIIDGDEVTPGVFRVKNMVEKPAREDAPSRMAIVGRYVLTPDIFDYLEKVEPGHGGEIQLTDALQAMAQERGMMAVRMSGMRFDAGDWAEFLTANIYFALQDEELRYDLLKLLKNFVQFH